MLSTAADQESSNCVQSAPNLGFGTCPSPAAKPSEARFGASPGLGKGSGKREFFRCGSTETAGFQGASCSTATRDNPASRGEYKIMKTLKFKDNLVPLVLSGEKDSTWRLFDDKDLKVNDELLLINKDTLDQFGKASILFIREKRLGDLEDSDFNGHEKFESEEKMYESYRNYYGDRVTPDSIVKIIKFKLKE